MLRPGLTIAIILTSGALYRPVLAQNEGQIPQRRVQRPLALNFDKFGILFEAGYTLLDRRDWAVPLRVGAAYGLTENVELGLRLIHATLSEVPDTGLEQPSVYGRLYESFGAAQLGIEAEIDIPTGDPYYISASGLFRLGLGRYARIDFSPRIAAQQAAAWRWPLQIPLQVMVQLGDQLSLSAGGAVAVSNLVAERPALWAQAFGELSFTFIDDEEGKKPAADLACAFYSETYDLRKDQAQGPSASALLWLRIFYDNPSEPWMSDSSDERW